MADIRLADMVEDEGHLRAAPRELDRVGERPVLDADIEGEAVLRQKLDGFEEGRLETEGGVALGLDEPPDAAQDAVLLQGEEVGLDRLSVFERRMGDHAGEPRIAVRKPLDEACFLEMQAGIDGDFREHDLVDLDSAARAIEILEERSALQLRRAIEPAVAKAIYVIEMDMAVDDREVRHLVLLRSCIGHPFPRREEDALALPRSRMGAARAGSRSPEKIRSDLGDLGDAAKPHDAIDLAAIDFEHMRHARLAGDRQAPQMRASDEAGASAERERDDHIDPAPDATVEENRNAARRPRSRPPARLPRPRPRRRAADRHGSRR